MKTNSKKALANNIETPEELARYSLESTNIPEVVNEPTIPLIMIPTTLSGGEVGPVFILHSLLLWKV